VTGGRLTYDLGSGLAFYSSGTLRTVLTSTIRFPEGWTIHPLVGGLANRSDSFAFAAMLTAPTLSDSLFLYQQEGGLTLIARSGDPAPHVAGALYDTQFGGYALNDTDEVAFETDLSCVAPCTTPDFISGVFMAGLPRVQIPNGDFEAPGEGRLPAGWSTTWSDPGAGSAFRYDSGGADSWTGGANLRLHVPSGGGSTFVLSDPLPVVPETNLLISARMRYSLPSSSDDVFLTVIQVNRAGDSVGFNEGKDEKGEEFWSWHSKRIRVRIVPEAVAIRLRLGLVASSEAYMDVDSVR
jgi:hypothetical protein